MKTSTRIPLAQAEAEKFTKGLVRQRLSCIRSQASAGNSAKIYTFDGIAFAEESPRVQVGSVQVSEVLPFACAEDFMIIGTLRVGPNSEIARIESVEMGYDSFADLLNFLRKTPTGVPFVGKLIRFDLTTLALAANSAPNAKKVSTQRETLTPA